MGVYDVMDVVGVFSVCFPYVSFYETDLVLP